jgi:hypothetical protein
VFSFGVVFSDSFHESSARKISCLSNVLNDFAEQHHFRASENVSFDCVTNVATLNHIANFVTGFGINPIKRNSRLGQVTRTVIAWFRTQFGVLLFGQSKSQLSPFSNPKRFHELTVGRSYILPAISQSASNATVRKAFQDLSAVVSMKLGRWFNFAAITASACLHGKPWFGAL